MTSFLAPYREQIRVLFGQAMRYGLVGIISNITLYLVFIVLATLGVPHMAAMTMCFALGCLATYVAHGCYSFKAEKLDVKTFIKHLVIYSSAYGLNYLGLYLMVDVSGIDVRLAQGVMIVVVSLYLFILFRLVVFKSKGLA